MTFEELNRVRMLKRRLAEKEEYITVLKECVENITPRLDGLPHGNGTNDKTGRLAALIADTEDEIQDLRREIQTAAEMLINSISEDFDNPADKNLLILRYVAGNNFRKIGKILGYSESRVYFFHREILRNIK